MKTSFFNIILVLTLSFILIACSNDDKNDEVDFNTILELTGHSMQSSSWEVTSYIDSGEDKTDIFNGYVLYFWPLPDYIVTANNGKITHTGTWSVVDNDIYTQGLEDVVLTILFKSPDEYVELSGDWNFISRTETKIEIIKKNEENGDTNYLTLENI